jgi:integrase
MRTKHLCKRGSRYIYRCRVPFDLLHNFPSPIIWKNLRTSDKKIALIFFTAVEYRTQQLFMQLRTGMLSKELQKRLVALYQNSFATAIKADATGQVFAGTEKDDTGASVVFDRYVQKDMVVTDEVIRSTMFDPTPEKILEQRTFVSDYFGQCSKTALPFKDTSAVDQVVQQLSSTLLKSKGIKLSSTECKALALELTNADKTIYEVQSAVLRGEWSPLELLQQKVENELSHPLHDLKKVLTDYHTYYLHKNPHVRPGTKDDVDVECRVLLEILGNISIHEANTVETLTKLKAVLLKFPKNKQQRFGDRSIHSIIKQESGYEVIHRKTANNYLRRLKAVIDFAIKNRWVSHANVVQNEFFKIDSLPEEERLAYTKEDLERLIDALCTKPLWTYGENKDSRFWVILICLFHGLRLGQVVALTKDHLVEVDGATCFDLTIDGRAGVKTKNAADVVPVHWALVLLGFLEWADQQPARKLFNDTSRTLSAWYNRRENDTGFEPRYVTKDPRKCLYSTRHNFGGELYDADVDVKIVKEAMGHAPDKGDVTRSRYLKRSKIRKLIASQDKMRLEGIDLDRLEARARELFGLTES